MMKNTNIMDMIKESQYQVIQNQHCGMSMMWSGKKEGEEGKKTFKGVGKVLV